MENRRNLLIYRNKTTGMVRAFVLSNDTNAKQFYNDLVVSGDYDQVELFGREYSSYELEAASEDC